MRKQLITSSVLNSLKPEGKPYFIRDKSLTGFAVKVNPTGRVKFVSEVRQDGRLYRKSLGEHPMLDLQDARSKAMEFISQVRADIIAGSITQTEKFDSIQGAPKANSSFTDFK